jgi:hypothetical protein
MPGKRVQIDDASTAKKRARRPKALDVSTDFSMSAMARLDEVISAMRNFV